MLQANQAWLRDGGDGRPAAMVTMLQVSAITAVSTALPITSAVVFAPLCC